MTPLTREWVEKAEGDYESAGLLLRARKHPNYDASCFHSQQCAEKYMKATLCEARLTFQRTHDLSVLLDLLKAINPLWEAMRQAAVMLSDYGVRFRYPGSSADKQMAKAAVAACDFVRMTMRDQLGVRTVSRSKRKTRARRKKHK